MLDAIEAIDRRLPPALRELESDELVRVWVIHHLEILGEAARGLSSAFREQHPEVPWAPIADIRNRVSHVYWRVNMSRVWDTVTRDLPQLRERISSVLDAL